ncbi:CorA family divalent cation transporter, partial [Burkholderia vietnamiensis]|uniref:CorA family divalent cation transporter n=1 Tax=Burkholderia vietnamiensis TaxID=60552 RepID=UPI000A458995
MDLIVQTYGADTSGMVCGFRFTPGGAGAMLDAEAAAAWPRTCRARDASAADDFVWLHFNLAHGASERWMRTHLGLPDSFFAFLHEGSRSTRIEQEDGALRAIVNDVMFNLELTPSEIATLFVHVERRIMVTARMKPLRSVDTLRACVRDGERFRSPAELLVHLLRDQADLLIQ